MVNVIGVDPDSLAARKGIISGDRIININGQTVRDYIDYLYLTADDEFEILLQCKNGSYKKALIKRNTKDNLGINLEGIIYDQLKACQNQCLFCFIDQQPDGLRETLVHKDDDYRFSFLQGSFITLTNLSEEELKRIINLKLSPLNISIHSTNPELRIRMMKNKNAGKIVELLSILADNSIEFNTQIVLCPGLNDGPELNRTINDLLDFYPELISIGVVPVGLTKHRNNLVELESYNSESSQKVLKQIEEWQLRIKKLTGENILYAADEFYLAAGEEIPTYKEYNDFPQLENGIGLTRLLWNELKEIEPLIPDFTEKTSIGLITGKLGVLALRPVIERLKMINGLDIYSIPLKNYFFGEYVTVTGLLTGCDIIKGLKLHKKLPKKILIPDIMLNEDKYFLDNLKLQDIQKHFPDVRFNVCSSLQDIIEVIRNG